VVLRTARIDPSTGGIDYGETHIFVGPNYVVSGQARRVAALRRGARDVYDQTIRINEMIDTLRELLTTALEANLSLISVSQNEAMKRLAGWVAIIAVTTMIAGIYGMNFKFMPELEWPFVIR
jgi:Mg2+ and Co2+ transporter CorA